MLRLSIEQQPAYVQFADAVKLCNLCEELDISFIEEPIFYNDPTLLAHLRSAYNHARRCG